VVTEEGSYLRIVDLCITQLKAQGPSRTCNESKEEEEEEEGAKLGAIMLKNAPTHLGAMLRRAATTARQRTAPPAALQKARCFVKRGGPPEDGTVRTPVMIIRC